jgi:hypothetical protein
VTKRSNPMWVSSGFMYGFFKSLLPKIFDGLMRLGTWWRLQTSYNLGVSVHIRKKSIITRARFIIFLTFEIDFHGFALYSSC